MKKIERLLRNAWDDGESLEVGNSRVIRTTNSVSLFLHGHMIAQRWLVIPEVPQAYLHVAVNLCGWNTVTTRSRLTNVVGIRVYNIRRLPHIEGKEIPVNGWVSFNLGMAEGYRLVENNSLFGAES